MKREETYRKFSIRDGVFGIVGSRWLVTDLWWTDDYKEFGKMFLEDGTSVGLPPRVLYYGKKWCWSIGARHQAWCWRQDRWSTHYYRFVVWPRDHRERWDRAHPHEKRMFEDARKWRRSQASIAQWTRASRF